MHRYLILLFVLAYATVRSSAEEQCIYFPNCAQINPDKHPEYRVLTFDELDQDGRNYFIKNGKLFRLLNTGQIIPLLGLPVSFTAKRSCTAVLYLDGKLIFSKEVEKGESVSVMLNNLSADSNSTKVLQLRAILPGSAGSTIESSEVKLNIVLQSPTRPTEDNFPKSTADFARSPDNICDNPLKEVSGEDAGDWQDDWFVPRRCNLSHYNASEAQQCLANQTLLFAGDAMVRHIFVGAASVFIGETTGLVAARDGDVLHIEPGTTPEAEADIRHRCSRRMRYVNHIFCEGRIRTRFDLDGGGRLDYFGVWSFQHRNALLRELYRRMDEGRPPAMLVLGVGSHELAAVRWAGTADYCPEECVCASGLREWFSTLQTVLEGDATLRDVPAVMVLPAAQNEALKPADYAWQSNDLVLHFNARAAAVLAAGRPTGRAGGRGGLAVLDPYWMTVGRGGDSVDSVHYGSATNVMLAQLLLNHFCRA